MKEKWEIKRLEDVCETLNGLWTGKKEPFINVGVIRNTNFTKDCKLDDTDIAYLDVEVSQFKQRKLQFGDVIIEKSGGSTNQPVGRVVLFEKDNGNFSFSNFTSTIRIKDFDEINSNFLHKYLSFLYFSGYTERLQSNTTGIRNLDFNTYKKTPIPIPPLSVQQSIVSELDTLHRLKELQEQQLTEFDNLAQSTFYSLFGDPIENEKGWEVRKLGEVAPVKGFKGSVQTFDNKFWLLNLDVVEQQSGEILSINLVEENEINQSTVIFNEDNVLYSKLRPYLNKVVIPHTSGYCTSELLPLLPKKDLLNRVFLTLLLRSYPFVEYIQEKTNGAKMPRVNMDEFRNFNLIIPPLSLQTAFAERIEKIEAQKELVKRSIAETQTLIDYTMDKYFG